MKYTYFIKNKTIYIKVPYEEREKAKAISGFFWNKEYKMWEYPIFPQDYETINNINNTFGFDIQYKDVMEIETDIVRSGVEVEVKENVLLPSYQSVVKPFQHQINVVNMMMTHNQFGLFMEMGTGKTKCVVDWYGIRHIKDIDTLLIICPKSVISSWIDEWTKHGYKENEDFVVLEGTKSRRLKLMDKKIAINIINYEGLNSIVEKIDIFNSARVAVVLDESSKIKNPQAKRTRLILKTFVDNKYRFALSGTPITQSPVDIFAQFAFLDKAFLGFKSYYTFRNYYCVMGGYLNYQIVGYNNLEQLKENIENHSIILKKEQCLDLPPKIYEKRIIDMSTEMTKQHKQMKKDLMLELSGEDNITAQIILVKLLRLQQILSGRWLENKKDNIKLKEMIEVIKDNSGGVKTIIWCRFIDSIKIIKKQLDIHNIKSVVFCGQEISDDEMIGDDNKKMSVVQHRQNVINKFQNDKDVTVFIGQIQTGGMGITLTAASMVIYYENNFSLQDRMQSEDRCHRIGQKNNVTYIDMLYKGTIDEDIMKAIESKRKLTDYLVGGVKEILKV